MKVKIRLRPDWWFMVIMLLGTVLQLNILLETCFNGMEKMAKPGSSNLSSHMMSKTQLGHKIIMLLIWLAQMSKTIMLSELVFTPTSEMMQLKPLKVLKSQMLRKFRFIMLCLSGLQATLEARSLTSSTPLAQLLNNRTPVSSSASTATAKLTYP